MATAVVPFAFPPWGLPTEKKASCPNHRTAPTCQVTQAERRRSWGTGSRHRIDWRDQAAACLDHFGRIQAQVFAEALAGEQHTDR